MTTVYRKSPKASWKSRPGQPPRTASASALILVDGRRSDRRPARLIQTGGLTRRCWRCSVGVHRGSIGRAPAPSPAFATVRPCRKAAETLRAVGYLSELGGAGPSAGARRCDTSRTSRTGGRGTALRIEKTRTGLELRQTSNSAAMVLQTARGLAAAALRGAVHRRAAWFDPAGAGPASAALRAAGGAARKRRNRGWVRPPALPISRKPEP